MLSTRQRVHFLAFCALLAGFSFGCRSTGPSVESLRQPQLCQSGNSVDVAWPERLYPAKVLRDLDSSGLCLVVYLDKERQWTERVLPSHVYGQSSGSGPSVCEAGASVWVDWHGTQWYEAQVRESLDGDGLCPIHYVGYDASWDESVSLERLRAGDSSSTEVTSR